MHLTPNTGRFETVKDLEKQIEVLRTISKNKARLILTSSKRNDQACAKRLEDEKLSLDTRIAIYQKDILRILAQKEQSQAANDKTFDKTGGILGKVKNFIGNILEDKTEKKFKWLDTLAFLAKPNVSQSTDRMQDPNKWKHVSFFGKVQFRDSGDNKTEKENFRCVCQYTQVLEKRNKRWFPMIALIFRDPETNEILGRNVGYLNEKAYWDTWLFLVESATNSRALVCLGNTISKTSSNMKKAA